ncbi:MAG: hypothetical protein RL758_178 [Pseudomonadota bacterium]
MTERRSLTLHNWQTAAKQLRDLAEWMKAMLIAGHKLSLEVKKATRSTEQNNLMWSVLTDLSKQCEWAVDGQMTKLSPEDVKHILTAGLKCHQRMARGIDGGVVILGQSTSKMTVQEMSELITLGHAYGDQAGVVWSRTSLGRDAPEGAFE